MKNSGLLTSKSSSSSHASRRMGARNHIKIIGISTMMGQKLRRDSTPTVILMDHQLRDPTDDFAVASVTASAGVPNSSVVDGSTNKRAVGIGWETRLSQVICAHCPPIPYTPPISDRCMEEKTADPLCCALLCPIYRSVC